MEGHSALETGLIMALFGLPAILVGPHVGVDHLLENLLDLENDRSAVNHHKAACPGPCPFWIAQMGSQMV